MPLSVPLTPEDVDVFALDVADLRKAHAGEGRSGQRGIEPERQAPGPRG